MSDALCAETGEQRGSCRIRDIPHKHLWTITLPTAPTLLQRSSFWAGFLWNPRKSSYDHQPQSSCMAPLWGWAILNWFKDIKQQNVTRVNHLSALLSDEEAQFACAVLPCYLPTLWLPSESHTTTTSCSFCKCSLYIDTCTVVYVQAGKILRLLFIFSLKSSSHGN